jgi:streptogramin lyase
VEVTPSGQTNTYNLPTANAGPVDVTYNDADGLIYFTEFNANQIGTISLNGTFGQTYGASGNPFAITSVNGSVYFTEYSGNQIGQLDPIS